MRIRLILLSCLLSAATVFGLTITETYAAARSVFKPAVPEDQTVAWLKEKNHDAEELDNGRYRIYWRDYYNLSQNNQRDEYGKSYTIRSFDWGPRGGKADVFVESRVEEIKPDNRIFPDTSLPEYRYTYSITSLKTSRDRVRSLWINTSDLPRNWKRYISNPPGWKNRGQPLPYEKASNVVTWGPISTDGYDGIEPGTFQEGFSFQCQGIPGIITADVWTTGGDPEGLETVVTMNYTQTNPQGTVVGPVAIPINTSPLALTRRLENLTSQSVELGWVDAGVAAPLQQHLTHTITAFGKNQHSQAKLEIQRFIETLKALEKQSQTPMSSGSLSIEVKKQNPAEPPILMEALTLLKTNAAYLLTKF